MRNVALGAPMLAVAAFAAPASAQTVTAGGGTNQDFTVSFNGFTDTVNPVPGLTAFVTLDFQGALVGAASSTYLFNYTVQNTSTAPVVQSRVSGFGFDTDPTVNVGGSSATGVYNVVSSGNVPIL